MRRSVFLGSLLVGLWTLIVSCEQEQPQQTTLFTAVSPDESKVYFNNEIVDSEAYNILLHANYYGGGGVAIGDINNDDLLDLYFTGNQVEDKLYLNRGGLEFEDITESAGLVLDGGWSSSVLLGDVNQDGYMDIYVTREMYGDNAELLKNKLYLNNQDQTFTEAAEQWGIAGAQRSRGGTFIDYDNDGDLDLFLLNTPPNPGPLYNIDNNRLLQEQYGSLLFENTGNSFVEVTQEAGLQQTGFPNSVVASDLNADGYTDLYVTNDFSVADGIFMNNGDGTFSNEVDKMTGHISFGSMGVDAADINNDGLVDVFVSDMSAEDNYRMKANMGGMNPDAFWKVVEDGHHFQYMYNTLQLNNGYGSFGDVAQLAGLATTDWSWSSLLADFDNDGYKDVFVANGVLKDIRNTDALNNLAQELGDLDIRLASASLDEPTAKIDGKDLQEMLDLFPSEKLLNYVYKNNGDFTFTKKMSEWGITEKSFSNGTAYGDLDNDGDLDLVINNINEYAQILENHAADDTGYLRVKVTDKATKRTPIGTKLWLYTNEGVQFAEITGSRGMYSSSEYIAHFGLGEHALAKQLRVRWSDGREQLIENPTINQMLEVTYEESTPAGISKSETGSLFTNITKSISDDIKHIENDFDDYALQVLLPHKMSTYGPGFAKGDVNGDGADDFYLGGAAGYPGQLYLQTAQGSFEVSSSMVFTGDKDSEDTGAVFFDADNDDDLDLYVVSGGNEFPVDSKLYQDRLYLNDGSGSFSKSTAALPATSISGSKVYPADFDNDNDLDLFVAGHHVPGSYPTPASSMLLRNNEGSFEDVTAELAPALKDIGMVNDATWIDVDNDNRQDLVLVGEWMPVTLLKNGESGFTNATDSSLLAETSGWWFSVEMADIDQDGDQDLIAGNLGLNYKYKATPEEPFTVYYHDFDLNGSKDIVLAYYNFGGLYPLRGRSCSSEQVPQISGKFGTYDKFAQSNVEVVYGSQNLEEALHYQANSFASAYFENQGNGTFAYHPLPMEAQISSVNDIVVDDFNGDDHLDIIIAGNLFNAEVETPRNDAGYSLVLVGDGKGSFEPMQPLESGLYLPYEVKNLSLLNGPKGTYLVAGCNDEQVQIFKQN